MSAIISIRKEKTDIWSARLFASIVLVKGANLTFQCTDLLPRIIENCLFYLFILFFLFALGIKLFRAKQSGMTVWVLVLVFSAMYFWAYLRYPEFRSDIIKRFVYTVILGMPCFASVYRVNDNKAFLDEIYKYSFVITVFGTMIFIGDIGPLSSNMSFSAMMLFPFAIHVTRIMRAKRKLPVCVLCAYELFIILVHGSRGGLVSAILCVLLFFGMKDRKNLKKIRWLTVAFSVFLIAAVAVLLNFESLMSVLAKRGIYIRNLDFLSKGIFISRSGRTEIFQDYMGRILDSFPIRFRIVDALNNGTNYPHNIFIEVLYNYGYFLGGLFIVLFMSAVIKRVFRAKGNDFDLFVVLLGAGLFPLLTSFTYFEWPIFWALLGYLGRNVSFGRSAGGWSGEGRAAVNAAEGRSYGN